MNNGNRANILLAVLVSGGIFLAMECRDLEWRWRRLSWGDAISFPLLTLPLAVCIFFRSQPPKILYAPAALGASFAFLTSPIHYAASISIPGLLIVAQHLEKGVRYRRAVRRIRENTRSDPSWIRQLSDPDWIDKNLPQGNSDFFSDKRNAA